MSLANSKQASRLGLVLPLLTIILLFSSRTARADEIAIWNFNDSDLLVDHGSGTLSTNFNLLNVVFNLGGTTTNARLGNPAGQALTLQGGSANVNNGRFLDLRVSTEGYGSIVISLATQATGTGFNNNRLQYSVDGMTFFDFAAPYSPAASYGLITFDLSGITGLNNNPDVAFRIVFNGATSATGNNRIDNLVIEGQNTTIPEPSTLWLLGIGLSGTIAVRSSRWLDWIRRRK